MLLPKLGFTLLILLSSLHAIEITVTQSKTTDASSLEAENFRNLLMKRNVTIDPEDAKRVVTENRTLADYYLKTYGIKNDKIELQILFEEKLKDQLIKKESEKIEINDDVLLSYYKNNKDEFYTSKEIEFKVYDFNTFEKAYDFFKICNENLDKTATLVAENNISVVSNTVPLNTLHPQLQNLLKDKNEVGYIAAPQKFFKKYIVFEVVSLKESGTKEFETVKEDVKKRLHKKIKSDVKTKLLEQLIVN